MSTLMYWKNIEPASLSRVTRWLIYSYLFLSFFEHYLSIILGSSMKYLLILIAFAICYDDSFQIQMNRYLCMLVWLMYKICTVLWTPDQTIFQTTVLSQISMVTVFVLILQVPRDTSFVKGCLFATWCGSALIGILSLFMSHPYHGIFQSRQVLVLFGAENDPNNTAAFLAVGVGISFYYLFFIKQMKLIAIFSILINSFVLLRTGSRGGLLTLLAILLSSVVITQPGDKLSQILKRVYLVVIICIAAIYIIFEYLPQDITERLFNLTTYEGGSERSSIWKNTMELFVQHPVFGAGFGAYFGYNGEYSAVHNTYLAILVEVGIVGAVLFAIPLWSVVYHIYSEKKMYILPILLSGLVPSFFIEAINKRFFWNTIIIAGMLLSEYDASDDY